MTTVADLQAELAAECESLEALVAGADVRTPTPAPGWDVGDQLAHLAFFDEAALLALTDPEGFAATRPSDEAGLAVLIESARQRGRERDVVAWWRAAWRALTAADVDGERRVPWYGPAMSVRSFLTARLMEAWAHGQDVADGLGVERTPTPRLRHVAQLGVLAFANSFRARGLEVPAAPVRVELDDWAWGPEDAADRVRGDLLGFCLVVTRRRHLDDTDLVVTGPVARRWMSIAQAFAGPPGPGRRPSKEAS